MKRKIFFILIIVVFLILIIFGKNPKITMTIKDGTLTRTSATVIITDANRRHTYGDWFKIERKEDEIWQEMETIGEGSFLLIAYHTDKDGKLEMYHNWENMYGELENGTYRLVKKVNDKYISVEFTITD